MNSEMVEKVARAIWLDMASRADKESAWDGFDANDRASYISMARAAIEAMREPTKEMVTAGDDEKEACIDSGWDSDADGNRYDYTTVNSDLPARVFRAMIAAALTPPR